MANHKRRRPKHQRAGCLLCKPHKDERRAKRGRRASDFLRELVEAGGQEFDSKVEAAYERRLRLRAGIR